MFSTLRDSLNLPPRSVRHAFPASYCYAERQTCMEGRRKYTDRRIRSWAEGDKVFACLTPRRGGRTSPGGWSGTKLLKNGDPPHPPSRPTHTSYSHDVMITGARPPTLSARDRGKRIDRRPHRDCSPHQLGTVFTHHPSPIINRKKSSRPGSGISHGRRLRVLSVCG